MEPGDTTAVITKGYIAQGREAWGRDLGLIIIVSSIESTQKDSAACKAALCKCTIMDLTL